MTEIINTEFFDPIIAFITVVKLPGRFIEISIPPGLSLDQNEILKYFDNNATMHFSRNGGVETLDTKISGTIKDAKVFDYLYSKYNQLNEMG